MESIFLKLLNMSITASYLALGVIAVRLLLKKAPRWITVALWAMVGLRLVLPVSIESVFSLIPNSQPIPQNISLAPVPQIDTGIPVLNSSINPILGSTMAATPQASVNPMQVALFIASTVWLLGMGAMALYTSVSYLRLRYKVREAVRIRENIYQCDRIPSPFILGMLAPRIYLPASMEDADIPYVVAHEKAHLNRLDHLVKPLGFALLAVYWFNPLLWIAYILLCRDIEVACDEKVLKNGGAEIKKAYSAALLNCSISHRHIAACPLAFGEVGVKQRIKNVLSYKRPAFWVILIALIASIVLGLCLLTNPMDTDIPDQLGFQICQWIQEENKGFHTDERYVTVNYEIIGKETSRQGITVYMWVLYEEYSFDGELHLETGSHMLTAITAEKQEGNNYRLVEYWNPQDGRGYTDSIREKLPWYLHRKGLDSQRTAKSLSQLSRTKAELYFSQNGTPGSNAPGPGISIPEHTGIAPSESYLGLDDSNGLTVCVWQMAEHACNCVLLSGKNVPVDIWQLMKMRAVNLEQMNAILAAYKTDHQHIRVVPVQMPHSSYIGRTDDAFVQEIRKALGLDESLQLKLPYFTSKSIRFSAEIAGTSAADKELFPMLSVFPAHQVVVLPAWSCKSIQELEELMSALSNSLDMNTPQYGLPSIREVADGYTQSFFQDKGLMVVYAPVPDSSYQIEVASVTWFDNGKLQANVKWSTTGEGDTAIFGRLIFIAVDKPYVEKSQSFSATLSLDIHK